MSLPVLVIIVVFGIALTVAAVHWTGGSRTAKLQDSHQAIALFTTDYPDEPVQETFLTSDGATAFLMLAGGRIGTVQSLGDGFFTRIVSRADISRFEAAKPGRMMFRLRDFTWKGGDFFFVDARAAAAISARLGFENSMEA